MLEKAFKTKEPDKQLHAPSLTHPADMLRATIPAYARRFRSQYSARLVARRTASVSGCRGDPFASR